MSNWVTLHPKVFIGGVVAIFLGIIAPWAKTKGVDIDPQDPNVKMWLTLLATYLTPGGANAAPTK